MNILETDRLILRVWNIDDASDVYEYAKSEKWDRWLVGNQMKVLKRVKR